MAAPANNQGSASAGFVLAWLLVAYVTSFHIDAAKPVSDLFQEGEYLAPRLYAMSGAASALPVLIHGMLDYVPARIAALAGGEANAIIVYTRLINMSFVMLSSMMLCAIVDSILMKDTRARVLGCAGTALFLVLHNGACADTVALQQGAPGIRDVFVLFELLIICRLSGIDADRRRLRDVLLALLGIVSAVGVFWAYNRGLVGLVVLAAYVSSGSFLKRDARPLLIATAAFSGTVLIQYAVSPQMLPRHIANIDYWIRHEGIWRYPLTARHFIGVEVPAILIVTVPSLVNLLDAVADWRARRRELALFALLLAVFNGLSLMESLNRVDWPHCWSAFIGVCPSLALIAARRPRLLAWIRPVPARRAGAAIAALLVASGVALAAGVPHGTEDPLAGRIMRGMAALARNPGYLSGHVPAGRMVDADTQAVARYLSLNAAGCTVVLDNSGVIYDLARLPPCSRYMYPVYVGTDAQADFIADVGKRRPETVLLSSGNGWDAIDGRSLAERTPMIAEFMRKAYPYRSSIGRYVVGSVRPPEAPALAGSIH